MEVGIGKKLLVSAIAFAAVVGGYLFWQNRETNPVMVSPLDPTATSLDSAVVTEVPEDKDSTPIVEASEVREDQLESPEKVRSSTVRSTVRSQINQQTSLASPSKEDFHTTELMEPINDGGEEHLLARGGEDLPFMQVWGGLGINYISFSEDSSGGSNTGKFANLSGPTFSLGVNVRFAEHHRGQFEYHDWPGTATADNSIQIDHKNYRWKNILAEYQYIFSQSSENVFTALVGAQIHQVPFIIFNNDGSQTLSQNELRNLSLGVKWQRFTETGFEYSALARYQHILDSGSTDGLTFKTKSGKIIDASVGISRRFKNNMTFGFFWLGQYQNFDFDFSNSSIAASGDQSLFNSNFQIRIGYDFF